MKKKMSLVMAGAFLMAAAQTQAATITEMFFDAGGGTTADITVDDLGVVSCAGTCGGLVLPGTIVPHGTLIVSGTLGQYTLSSTGKGGVSVVVPTLQNLTQNEASSVGAGTLFVEFTDTDYCMGGGGCFGSAFTLAASGTNDIQIKNSTTDVAAFMDPGNGIPAGNFIGGFTGLTGLSYAVSQNFPNPSGPGATSGSLSTATLMTFTGKGSIQSTFTISAVPEPGTLGLLGIGGAFMLLGFRRRVRL